MELAGQHPVKVAHREHHRTYDARGALSLDAVVRAWHRALRGKRSRADVARYSCDAEARLVALHRRLADGRWRPGPYRVFTVREPVVRTIAALPFEDRIVQHALMGVVAPRITRCLAPQTFACIPGRGSHGALASARESTRLRRWCLRLDVRKFFPSVDHGVLRAALSALQRPGEQWIGALEGLLLDHQGPFERAKFWFPGDDLLAGLRPRGIPIGNLTSKWWANLLLSPLDHLLANHLGVRDFVRYMDDLVIFDDSRSRLESIWRRCDESLTRLRLRAHPIKCGIVATRDGVDFLGFRLRRTDGGVAVRIADASVDRFRERMGDLVARYAVDAVEAETVRSHIAAWMGHAGHGHTRALCETVLSEFVFVRTSGRGDDE